MPYIEAQVNIKITKEKEIKLKEELGKAINVISGKTEKWLMVNIRDNQTLYFAGDNSSPICWCEVKIFGAAPAEELENMTKRLCGVYKDVLNIAPDHTYIKYEFSNKWGWNGTNF